MGNTSSSPTSSSFSISRPRTLGNVSSPPRSRHRLGPDIITPYPPNIESRVDPGLSTHGHGHEGTNSDERHADSLHAVYMRKSQTFRALNNDIASSAVDVRRTRSAAASTSSSTRASRASEFLGAPPPYSQEDVSSSNLHLPIASRFLDVPPPVPPKSHRRTSSDSAMSPTTTPSTPSTSTSWTQVSHQRSRSNLTDRSYYDDDYGYGIGNGLAATGTIRAVGTSTSTSSPTMPTFPFPEPETGLVRSPTSSSAGSGYAAEDPLELLKMYKTVFVIDDSASMAGERWVEAREALGSLADVAARYETDGFDAYFINAKRSAQSLRSSTSVKRFFDSVQPQGISLLGSKLEEMLNEYITELEGAQREVLRGDLRALHRIPPMNYIVLTDGMPTDDPEAVIVQAARRLDKNNIPISQVGIQFVQVGDDRRASEALKELDDDIAKEYGVRDMVDFTPCSGEPLNSEELIKILLGGINRRVDRKGARSVLP